MEVSQVINHQIIVMHGLERARPETWGETDLKSFWHHLRSSERWATLSGKWMQGTRGGGEVRGKLKRLKQICLQFTKQRQPGFSPTNIPFPPCRPALQFLIQLHQRDVLEGCTGPVVGRSPSAESAGYPQHFWLCIMRNGSHWGGPNKAFLPSQEWICWTPQTSEQARLDSWLSFTIGEAPGQRDSSVFLSVTSMEWWHAVTQPRTCHHPGNASCNTTTDGGFYSFPN